MAETGHGRAMNEDEDWRRPPWSGRGRALLIRAQDAVARLEASVAVAPDTTSPPACAPLERGLVEVRSTNRGPRSFFTESGMAARRQPLMDRRAIDPERFGHLRAEFGLPIDNA